MKSLLAVLSFTIFFSVGLKANNGEPKKKRELRKEIIDQARSYLGSKYKFGGTTPGGFDCSGFTKFIFESAGADLARTSKEQASQGEMKRIDELIAGDLVFFQGTDGQINHVALVLRSSKRNLIVVHATSSRGVMIDDIKMSDYWKGRLSYGVDVLKN